MAAPLHNNLPPQSQQWVRDIERRMKALEQQNQLLQVTANQNATTIGAVQGALYQGTPIISTYETPEFTLSSGATLPVNIPIAVTIPKASSRALVVAKVKCLVSDPSTSARANTVFWAESDMNDFEPRVVSQQSPITSTWGPYNNSLLDVSFEVITPLTAGSTITLNTDTTAISAGGSPRFIVSATLTIYPETSQESI